MGHDELIAVCFTLWKAMGFGHAPDAPVIANAIVTSAEDNPIDSMDVLRTVEVMAEWAGEESGVQLSPKPYISKKTGRPIDSEAHGFLQLHGNCGLLDPTTQGRCWLVLAHWGQVNCPESPLAPLSGSCTKARKLAERRIAKAFRLAETVQ